MVSRGGGEGGGDGRSRRELQARLLSELCQGGVLFQAALTGAGVGLISLSWGAMTASTVAIACSAPDLAGRDPEFGARQVCQQPSLCDTD